MTKEIIIKNAHCKFFEGQTGLCRVKEFTKCNPVNCKSYTIDELSTISELQQKLKEKEQECEELKSENFTFEELIKTQEELIDNYKQALDEIEKFIKNQLDGFGNDVYSMHKSAINNIQDIINKAKR